MEDAVRRQVADMGIDPGAGGRIRYDIGEREGKRSRAFCAPVRVPDEVYLVMRPHGGQTDYQTLCTNSDTRCTSRTRAPTIHSSTAGWATTP